MKIVKKNKNKVDAFFGHKNTKKPVVKNFQANIPIEMYDAVIAALEANGYNRKDFIIDACEKFLKAISDQQ